MMNKSIFASAVLSLLLALLALPALAAGDQDARQKVDLPEMMKQHMLGNMRDHLQALHEIQLAMAKGELDQAGDIAEQRIGMSSLAAHHAASRFAMTVREGDTLRALDSLSRVTQQCIACHAAYRLN